jgi:hypothetical protein
LVKKQVGGSKFLKMKTTSLVNRNSQKTSWPSYMSSLPSKWENEAIPVAKVITLIVKIYPTTNQKKLLDEYIDASRYVYNRTLEFGAKFRASEGSFGH